MGFELSCWLHTEKNDRIIQCWKCSRYGNNGSRKGEPKGNQRGTFSNLLSSNRFIEIHRLKSIILVPPGGNFKSVTHQRIYEKVPYVPLFLNSYIEIFSPSHKKNKNNNGHTKKSVLYVSHVCIIKKKGTYGTFCINVLSSNGFSGSLLVPPVFL